MKSILKPPYESSKVSYKPSGIEWLEGGGGVKSQPIGK